MKLYGVRELIQILFQCHWLINSLVPGDAIWRQRLNIGSGNGMLPDGTKPLPEPMNVDLSSVRLSDIHLWAILQEIPQPLMS